MGELPLKIHFRQLGIELNDRLSRSHPVAVVDEDFAHAAVDHRAKQGDCSRATRRSPNR